MAATDCAGNGSVICWEEVALAAGACDVSAFFPAAV